MNIETTDKENLQSSNPFSGKGQENISGMAGENFERQGSLPTFQDAKDGEDFSSDLKSDMDGTKDFSDLRHDLPQFEDKEVPSNQDKIDHAEVPNRGSIDTTRPEKLEKPHPRSDEISDSSLEVGHDVPGKTEDLNTKDVNEEKSTGGTYGDLKNQWKGELEKEPPHEIHHMPANDINGLTLNDGPAIVMDKADHRQTASCGSSLDAREYRAEQKELVDNGKFKEAMQMDIDDIHDKFGDKYDEAIAQMKEKAQEKGLI